MEKITELSKPVVYSLRFRNMNGEPDKNINANTTFSTLEKAKAYGLGSRYVTQDDGKIVSVRDPSQDPIVEPLYSQEYVSALIQRIAELERANQSQDDHINQQQDRIDSLEKTNARLGRRLGDAEKRLATPVRLPKTNGYWTEQEKAFEDAITLAKREIRLAGFTVEGDEQ